MIVRSAARFLDERFGSDAFVRKALDKIYPDNWSFYLGEFALYCFIVLVATGIWLTFFFEPSSERAYDSVMKITTATPLGYLIRQVHHWSAVVFVAAIVVHMSRIFFTAAYRKPRELNWVVGFTMLTLASLTGFTGYSLPDDSLSGTGLRIATAVMQSIPFVGRWSADVVNGGSYPGTLLIPHLYVIHVYYLPIAIAALLALHLGMLVYQKHTQFVKDEAHVVGRRFWPDYALRTLAAFAATVSAVFALAGLVQINPIWRYGKYADWTVPNPAVPDWYAGWLDGGLRLGPAIELRIFGHPIPAIFWPGFVLPTIGFLFFILWPWIDRRITGQDEAHDVLEPASARPWRAGVGAGLITAGVVLTLAASDDQMARSLHVSVAALVWVYRILFLFGSIAVGFIASAIATEVRARRLAEPVESERVVELVRNAAGGFDERRPSST